MQHLLKVDFNVEGEKFHTIYIISESICDVNNYVSILRTYFMEIEKFQQESNIDMNDFQNHLWKFSSLLQNIKEPITLKIPEKLLYTFSDENLAFKIQICFLNKEIEFLNEEFSNPYYIKTVQIINNSFIYCLEIPTQKGKFNVFYLGSNCPKPSELAKLFHKNSKYMKGDFWKFVFDSFKVCTDFEYVVGNKISKFNTKYGTGAAYKINFFHNSNLKIVLSKDGFSSER